jgi:hypothetical protein
VRRGRRDHRSEADAGSPLSSGIDSAGPPRRALKVSPGCRRTSIRLRPAPVRLRSAPAIFCACPPRLLHRGARGEVGRGWSRAAGPARQCIPGPAPSGGLQEGAGDGARRGCARHPLAMTAWGRLRDAVRVVSMVPGLSAAAHSRAAAVGDEFRRCSRPLRRAGSARRRQRRQRRSCRSCDVGGRICGHHGWSLLALDRLRGAAGRLIKFDEAQPYAVSGHLASAGAAAAG